MFGDEELTISQVQPDVMLLFSDVVPELSVAGASGAVKLHSHPHARRGLQPLLSGKDFILPQAEKRLRNRCPGHRFKLRAFLLAKTLRLLPNESATMANDF